MTEPAVRSSPLRRRVVLAGAATSAAAGCAALAGWYGGLPVLTGLDPRLIPMAPSTALLLLLFGGTLGAYCLAPGRRWALRLRLAAAVFGILASLALLVLSSLKIHFRLEHLGLPVPSGSGPFPLGHMSPVTALCLLFAGLALLGAPADPERDAAPPPWSLLPASMLVAASGAMALAYLFGTPVLYSGTLIPPAATTVAALFALGIAEAGASWPRRATEGPDRAGRRETVLLILAFLGLATGIIGAGVHSYRQYERRYRTEVERQLAAVAELKVVELVRWRGERLADAASLLDNPAFSALVCRALAVPGDAEALRLLQGWVGSHQRHEGYSRIALLDAGGVERLAAPAPATSPDSALSHDFGNVLQALEISFLDLHRHAPGGEASLGLVVPIFDRPGAHRPLGVLLMSMNPASQLYPALQHWPIPSRTAETLLVRREGHEAVVLNALRFGKDAVLELRIPLDRTASPAVAAVLGPGGLMEGSDYRGVRVVADTRPVPGSPWSLAAKMDLAEIYAPQRERLWLTVALMAALLLGAGAGIGLLWRQRALGQYRERLAAESERSWLRTVIARSLNEIYVFDAATLRFTFANDGACRNLGYPLEELLALTPVDVQPRLDAAVFAGLLRPLREGTIAVLTFVTSHRRKDGSEYPVEAHLQPVESGRGPVFLAVVNDISERRRAEETIARLNAGLEQRVAERTVQLEGAVRELETFAYSVSHDLRSPLRVIEGFAWMLAHDYAAVLDAEGHRLLAVVRANARRMDALIADLLNFSRLTRSELHGAGIDMAALAAEVFREVASPQERQDVSFAADGLPGAWGDPGLVRQVWSNLLANALKFSRSKPQRRILVEGRIEGAMAVYTVGDTGVGFDQAYVGRIFRAFERLHPPEEFEGTGIGLAIVKRIVQRHGGQVLARGTPGEGAVFTFSLPAAPPDGAPPEGPAVASEPRADRVTPGFAATAG